MDGTATATVTKRGAAAVAAGPGARSRPSRRWTVFVHQDGILLSPTIRALTELGILEQSLNGEHSLGDLYPGVVPEGFGYLRVGLRCLASQGWLDEGPTLAPETTVLRWTDAGRQAAPYFDRYAAAGRLLGRFTSTDAGAWSRAWSADQVDAFLELVPLAADRWRLGDELPGKLRALITTHLDAALVVPAMLRLLASGRVRADGPAVAGSPLDEGIATLLTALGWRDGATGAWTSSGREAAHLAVHFGMAASYLPLLARLPELYRGELAVAPESHAEEWHCHRELNVIASSAAHTRYFDDADGIFVELFDREPVESQPRFVADMGCGDGSWLVHIHRLIAERTMRGRRLAEHPILMVGLDYNTAALERAREVLDEAGVPALLLFGDISDPDQAAVALAEHGLRMEDGLHVRAFIDHDRAYRGADPGIAVRANSSGAYVDGAGRPLDAAAIERDLVAHLRRWAPHVRGHGLVMLEAHCIAPGIARNHLGATHSVAFDAYHGYSHQYPIEHSAFLRCCREAGLQPASHSERRYPANRPFVAVSLNRLLVPETQRPPRRKHLAARDEDTWRPAFGTDLEDGRALHELLYVGGDLRYPRLWCSAPTGTVVAGALEVLESRLAGAHAGDVIRLLDYGAGTGLATIELLKACRERRIEERLERLGARLAVHLVDLPSSWFAQAYALLKDCPWVQFHSLRGRTGGFRSLLDVTSGLRVDAVMANMVFHLIPPRALDHVAADLARVLRPGGRLVWNSPDLGPPGAYAVLFHDANRALRRRWLELVAGAGEAPTARVHEAAERVRSTFDAAAMRRAQARADRRVLPEANAAPAVAEALARHFGGEPTLELPTHEILVDDLLDTLLVPSNQEEFLSEIADRDLREDVIRDLMLGAVLPAMREQPAGTAAGLNVQWAIGSAERS